MAYSVRNHRLFDDDDPVDFVATPNMGGTVTPRFLIMHYTAGTTAAGAISWLSDERASASAHLVIDRDGSVTQMVPFSRIAWHAGRSTWVGLTGLNAYSIGIELVNAGKLSQNGAGQWVNWAGNVIPPAEVAVMTHKNETSPAGWHLFTQRQIDVAVEIGVVLRGRYAFEDVIGHDDVAPGRKVDPGPAFPMVSFESRVMGRQ
ncbi:MAG: N-acetylmuramoyl-L-alanine amidase [Bauldia sp.]